LKIVVPRQKGCFLPEKIFITERGRLWGHVKKRPSTLFVHHLSRYLLNSFLLLQQLNSATKTPEKNARRPFDPEQANERYT
jgi:hypothetical protein